MIDVRRTWIFVAAVAGLLCPAIAQADDVAVIVGFHGQADGSVFARHGGRPGADLGSIRAHAGHVPAGKLQALRAEAGVAYVEEDLVRFPTSTPNDTYYATVPGYPASDAQADDFALINCPAAWEASTGAGVRVAVLDTGCQTAHPDISGKVKVSKNFTGGKATDVTDKDGHGTHTAGTVGAQTNNARGVAGAGWACELAIGKVLGPNGGYDSWIAAGINWAVDTAGASVISMSLGGGGYNATLDAAVNRAFTVKNALVVAAAGNGGSDGIGDNNDTAGLYPANYASCMSVAAVSSSGILASFSNYGATTVDIAAPGVRILSTYKGSTYAWLSGTSMATPHVSGVAALVRSHSPLLTSAQAWTALTSTAPLSVATPAGPLGLLDAAAAVGYAPAP